MDRHYASDIKFYDSLRIEGVLLAAPPSDLTTAVKQSKVVVVAGIGDVVPLRVIGDLQIVGLQLEIAEVVAGGLQPELKAKVIVEMPLGSPIRVNEALNTLRSTLPKGKAVWFLRWQVTRVQ